MIRKKLAILCLLTTIGGWAAAQPNVVAHWGYWNTEGSTPNSIAALTKADSMGCYAVTLDVWLTADDRLVVHHEPTYRQKSLIHSTATTLSALKLPNGERLPTLEEYFRAAKGLNVELWVELRNNDSDKRIAKARQRIDGLAARYGLQERVKQHCTSALAPYWMRWEEDAVVRYSMAQLRWGHTGGVYGLWMTQPICVGVTNKLPQWKWLLRQSVASIVTDEPARLLEFIRRQGRE